MRFRSGLAVAFLLTLTTLTQAAEPDGRFPLFAYLTGERPASMVAYVPSELDPRQEGNNRRLATSSIRADLAALRPAFDGLVLYGYHEAATPRILAVAKELKYRAVLLGVWDPKSAAELDGVAAVCRLHAKDLALGVLVGNEGVTFKRYEPDDVLIAGARLRATLPKGIPLATSEPLVQYGKPRFTREFGDFLAPNIHPVFDRKELSPKDAAAWARREALKLAEATGRPVLLKETGMPHGGTREGVKYGPQMQSEFWSAYLKPGHVAASGKAWVFHGVAFEAFDMPWKAAESRLEIEASWGLLSPKRQPHPAFEVWKSGK